MANGLACSIDSVWMHADGCYQDDRNVELELLSTLWITGSCSRIRKIYLNDQKIENPGVENKLPSHLRGLPLVTKRITFNLLAVDWIWLFLALFLLMSLPYRRRCCRKSLWSGKGYGQVQISDECFPCCQKTKLSAMYEPRIVPAAMLQSKNKFHVCVEHEMALS